jgi:hypothetical protein
VDSLSPSGSAETKVHLPQHNLINPNYVARVRQQPGVPQCFDKILMLHVLITVPLHLRRQALLSLQHLFTPNGRLILNMSDRFATGPS